MTPQGVKSGDERRGWVGVEGEDLLPAVEDHGGENRIYVES